MNLEKIDSEYKHIVNDILDDKEFDSLKTFYHHGFNRFDHSLRVSFYSYKIAKFLKLDYKKVAKGGLLHDFYTTNKPPTIKNRFDSFVGHPKEALIRSRSKFNLSDMEEDIIITHMFPGNFYVPRYAESWIVNFVDKTVSTHEFIKKFGYQMNYVTNLIAIMLLNFTKYL